MSHPIKRTADRLRPISRRDVLRGGAAALAAGGTAALAGCGSLLPPPKQTIIGIRIISDDTINPSPAGVAAPVVVRIYALKSNVLFLQSDFQTMFSGDEAYLGSSLAFRREVLVPPNANIPFKAEVAPEAEYVAAMALFRASDQSQWRVIYDLEPSKVNDLQLNVSENLLYLQRVIVGSRPLL
ncbi:type VI secretion system lipoprotein TssJ [Aquabacter spiritensis]|uniref:Type VI secretion system protein VasD n=1 Tax=Aquabacter spiritensis TaxID=933073 RepID=A0A4R3LVK5_9HYPH|nr:type VI secretion system lipoprotein TssJ [Aquabacter spiritensis]TCT02477.1 type VI secretion system protein VasD [Aquabacter spiritensis]